jgi:hypothetical protein
LAIEQFRNPINRASCRNRYSSLFKLLACLTRGTSPASSRSQTNKTRNEKARGTREQILRSSFSLNFQKKKKDVFFSRSFSWSRDKPYCYLKGCSKLCRCNFGMCYDNHTLLTTYSLYLYSQYSHHTHRTHNTPRYISPLYTITPHTTMCMPVTHVARVAVWQCRW